MGASPPDADKGRAGKGFLSARIAPRSGPAYIAPTHEAAWNFQRGRFRIGRTPLMDRLARLRRLRFRAWHRGTREADFLIGGYFDACHAGWSDEELSWFEVLLEEQDVDIMAWAIGTADVPDQFAGPMMERMKRLDFIDVRKDGA